MTTRQMTDTIFDRDLRSVYFFNGRTLSAEDLRKEQAGSREERRRLGRALGSGVAWGLEVRMSAGVDQALEPSVTITPGLALDRRGQTLLLEETVNLSLKIQPPRTAAAGITVFRTCLPPDAGVYVAGAGLYLLTLTSVEGSEGRAQVSGLGNVTAACNVKYHVPGLQFHLIQLDLPPADLQQPKLLRNRVAYRCFGDPDGGLFTDPFGPRPAARGLIDELRPNRLQDCEVPLALLYWTSSGGLIFVDMWAARRRVTAPDGAGWSLFTGDRRTGEAEARWMQFQAQLDDLRGEPFAANALKARDHFRFIPPAGLIPLTNAGHNFGFNETLFFQGITRRETLHIEGARLEYLLRAALAYPPLDLTSEVMVWVYRVRENAEAIRNNPASPPQPYLVYTTGHMPFLGDPHYDVNRWSYSNYV